MEDLDSSNVFCNVYDIFPKLNAAARFCHMRVGVFHTGVQVHGREFSFGDQGVFETMPAHIDGFSCREHIRIGCTEEDVHGVLVMVAELSDEWPGSSYHPFRRNCNHFADALCRKLTGAGMPTYVNRFATSIAAKAAFYCCLVPFECFLDWRCRGPSEASKDCCTDEQVKMTVAKVLSLEKEVARLRHELHSAEDFWQNEQAIIKTARLPRLETELRELRCELHVVKQYPSPRLQQAPQQLQLGPALHRCEQKGDQQHPAAASGTQLQQLRVLKRKVARLSKDAHLLKQFLAVSKVSPTASAHDLQPHSLLYRSQSRRLRVRYAQQRLCGKLGRRTKCCRHGKPRHRQWSRQMDWRFFHSKRTQRCVLSDHQHPCIHKHGDWHKKTKLSGQTRFCERDKDLDRRVGELLALAAPKGKAGRTMCIDPGK